MNQQQLVIDKCKTVYDQLRYLESPPSSTESLLFEACYLLERLKEINETLVETCKELRAILVTIEKNDPNLSAKQGAILRAICKTAEAAIAEAEPKKEGITIEASPEVVKSLNDWHDD